PKSATASGNVLAKQDRRRISADRINVNMTRLETPPPPGAPPGSQGKPQLAITELHAFGDVHGVDPAQRFRVTAEELDALIPNGREFKAATIVGPAPDVSAFVAYQDYQVIGHRIETDMIRQTADIAGPGRAYFLSDRDFGGGELRKAERTKISWNKFMRVRGRGKTAGVEGEGRAKKLIGAVP